MCIRDSLKGALGEHEIEIMDIAADLAELSKLEYKVVRYCKDEPSISDIQYIDYPTRRCKSMNINMLTKLFKQNGIKIDNSKTGKMCIRDSF